MALHVIFEAMMETASDADDIHRDILEMLRDRHGTTVELVWQTNKTDQELET